MTEQKAVNVMEKYTDETLSPAVIEAHKTAITALEEIKQYRALGTVEECREAVENQRAEKADREGNGCADEKLLTGWIPIEERRPETDTTVLITTSDGNVDTDFLRTSTRWYFSDDCVTAWMPLPEPYRPEVKLDMEGKS